MKVGFIGLGKMGGYMIQRLMPAGHEVVAYDVNAEAVAQAVSNGAVGVSSREELVASLDPVILWLMIPADFVDQELEDLLKIVPKGSILIDGGNSDYRLTMERANKAAEHGVTWLDVGTSGGIHGLKNGYAMMVGGDASAVKTISPLLDTLAQENGWDHFGPSGSGHYVKMIHNGIEYGMMQSYAEGYRLLKEGPINDIDLAAAAKVWQHGSIIESFLNELTFEAFEENPELKGIDGYVAESGEARWTLETAKDANIPLPAIEAAFQVRLDSQKGETNFATKVLAAMRNKFGGHAINKEK